MRKLRRRALRVPFWLLNVIALSAALTLIVWGPRLHMFSAFEGHGLSPEVVVGGRLIFILALVVLYDYSFRSGANLGPVSLLFFGHFVVFGALDWMAIVNANPDNLLAPYLLCLSRLAVAALVFWIWIEDHLGENFADAAAFAQAADDSRRLGESYSH